MPPYTPRRYGSQAILLGPILIVSRMIQGAQAGATEARRHSVAPARTRYGTQVPLRSPMSSMGLAFAMQGPVIASTSSWNEPVYFRT